MSALVIGAGINGLVAAFYLAKAGLNPVVLERRDEVGGGTITGDLHPGFRGPTLSHETLIHAEIASEMRLGRRVDALPGDTAVCAPDPAAPPIVLYAESRRSAESLRLLSAGDAARYADFRASLSRMAAVVAMILSEAPPPIERPSAGDAWRLLKAGRAFRALGAREGYRLLRALPMPSADFTREWFENDRLCAMLAAPGLLGTMLGPRSAGSMVQVLLREAHQQTANNMWRARGGPGAVSAALADAARDAGAEIRTHSTVERLIVERGAVTGAVVDGRAHAATVVVSGVDPRSTFLRLIDAAELPTDFAGQMGNYRARGTTAKINLALSALPSFAGVEHAAMLSGRVHIGPGLDYLERAFDHAKYGELSEEPWLDLCFPTITDPDLAPAGAHVCSIYMQYAPRVLREMTREAARDGVLQRTLHVLERYAPGISRLIVAAQVLTPEDLEREWGLAGGHIFHGELSLDQLFLTRPLIGYGRYETPLAGLYLCGAGSHPGGYATGVSGKLAARAAIRHNKS